DWVQLIGPMFESGNPFENVIRPTGFSEFAVIDDVNAGLGLQLHHVADGIAQKILIALLIWGGFRRFVGEIAKLLRADDAADVRGENSVLASFHGVEFFRSSPR